jgi:hypothetical protein
VRLYERGLEIDGIDHFHISRLSVPYVRIALLELGGEPHSWLGKLGELSTMARDVKRARLVVRLNDGSEHRFELFGAYYSRDDLSRLAKEFERLQEAPAPWGGP